MYYTLYKLYTSYCRRCSHPTTYKGTYKAGVVISVLCNMCSQSLYFQCTGLELTGLFCSQIYSQYRRPCTPQCIQCIQYIQCIDKAVQCRQKALQCIYKAVYCRTPVRPELLPLQCCDSRPGSKPAFAPQAVLLQQQKVQWAGKKEAKKQAREKQ